MYLAKRIENLQSHEQSSVLTPNRAVLKLECPSWRAALQFEPNLDEMPYRNDPRLLKRHVGEKRLVIVFQDGAAGGSSSDVIDAPSEKVEPVAATPPERVLGYHRFELNYLYADGAPIGATAFELFQLDDTPANSGKLDFNSVAYTNVEDSIDRVRIILSADPDPKKLLTPPTAPQTVVVPDGWMDRMSDSLESAWTATKDGAEWTWDTLQGDFNENPTVSQIITNTIITAIPVVDQIGDVRDISAALKQLVFDKRFKDATVWLALFLTLIGLIPTVGSVLKGVFKLIGKATKLDDLFRLFNRFYKGNAMAYFKGLADGKLATHADEAKELAHQLFDQLIDNMRALQAKIPASLTSLQKRAGDLLDSLTSCKQQINHMFAQIADDTAAKLKKLLDDYTPNPATASLPTKKPIVIQQKAMGDEEVAQIIGRQPEALNPANGTAKVLSKADMAANISKRIGNDFKNNPLRMEYEAEVAALSRYSDRLRPEMPQDELKALAYEANQARRDLGTKYKDATPEPLRDYIYAVNLERYQDPLGPTVEFLRDVKRKKFEDIVESASRPNPDIDKLLSGFKGWLDKQSKDYLQRFIN